MYLSIKYLSIKHVLLMLLLSRPTGQTNHLLNLAGLNITLEKKHMEITCGSHVFHMWSHVFHMWSHVIHM